MVLLRSSRETLPEPLPYAGTYTGDISGDRESQLCPHGAHSLVGERKTHH